MNVFCVYWIFPVSNQGYPIAKSQYYPRCCPDDRSCHVVVGGNIFELSGDILQPIPSYRYRVMMKKATKINHPCNHVEGKWLIYIYMYIYIYMNTKACIIPHYNHQIDRGHDIKRGSLACIQWALFYSNISCSCRSNRIISCSGHIVLQYYRTIEHS